VLHFNSEDCRMLTHTAEVITDRMLEEDGYTEADRAAVDKLAALAEGGSALVVTGEELDPVEARPLLWAVVETEMAHWVHGSSHRLINRAATLLGLGQPFLTDQPWNPACEPGECITAGTWIFSAPIMLCTECQRLYPAQ